MILSILVDTFFSKISLTIMPVSKSHNTVCVLMYRRSWNRRERKRRNQPGISEPQKRKVPTVPLDLGIRYTKRWNTQRLLRKRTGFCTVNTIQSITWNRKKMKKGIQSTVSSRPNAALNVRWNVLTYPSRTLHRMCAETCWHGLCPGKRRVHQHWLV